MPEDNRNFFFNDTHNVQTAALTLISIENKTRKTKSNLIIRLFGELTLFFLNMENFSNKE